MALCPGQPGAWWSFCTTFLHVLFGLPLGLEPSTSYSLHFFTQSVSSFRNTCPYHRNLFCCSINIISSIPSLSLNSLLGTLPFTLTLHIHLTILISACWSATSFSFLTGQVLLPCSILLCTQLLFPPSPNQWYIPIGKQWYQLPEFIPSNTDSGLWQFSEQRWEWSDGCVMLRSKTEFQVRSWGKDWE